jgi:replicative DNA helicase
VIPAGSSLFDHALRAPPANAQAEQALLGALLANNAALDHCDGLRAEHFADPVNGRVFETIVRRIHSGRRADTVTLRSDLEHAGILDEVGGPAYLAQLLSAMVAINTAGEYAATIRSAWVRRMMIEACAVGTALAYGDEPEVTAEAALSRTVDALLRLSGEDATRHGTPIGAAVAAVLSHADLASRGEVPRGLGTGMRSLDERWRGLRPGTLDILAGRPGAGKTALALCIAEAVARAFLSEGPASASRHVLFFSLEMPAAGLATRALSIGTGIAADDISEGRLEGERAHPDLVRSGSAWAGLPITVLDRPKQTLADIGLTARAERRANRAGLIVIDHAGKIRRGREHARMPETEWLSLVASDTHDLAVALEVPILLLWQLSREGGRRDNPRPVLADLKYAGEADADNVILLWRPERHLSPEPPARRERQRDEAYDKAVAAWHAERNRWRGRAEAIFAKRRAGPEGSVVLGFDGAATRFYDLKEQE